MPDQQKPTMLEDVQRKLGVLPQNMPGNPPASNFHFPWPRKPIGKAVPKGKQGSITPRPIGKTSHKPKQKRTVW